MRRRAASVVGAGLGRALAAEPQAAGLATGAAPGGLFGTGGRLAASVGRPRPVGQARAAAAVPAAAAAVRVQPSLLPLTRTDEFGAVSILESEADAGFVPQVFENVDGRRIEDGRYAAFTKELTGARTRLRAVRGCKRAAAFGRRDNRSWRPEPAAVHGCGTFRRYRQARPSQGGGVAGIVVEQLRVVLVAQQYTCLAPCCRGGRRACVAAVH